MKHQFMPMFWGDFFANTLHLSAQELGAYVLLIAHAWEHDAKIPLKGAQRIARVDNRHWREVWTTVAPFFTPLVGHGGLPTEALHSRVAKELATAAELSNKRKEAAEQMHANKYANANAKAMHVHLSTLPKEDRSLLGEEGKEGKEAPLPKPVAPTPGWRPRIDGDEERSPPRTKSDNELKHIPERAVKRE